MGVVMEDYPAMSLSREEVEQLYLGQAITSKPDEVATPPQPGGERSATSAYNNNTVCLWFEGHLVAIGERSREGRIQPRKLFNSPLKK